MRACVLTGSCGTHSGNMADQSESEELDADRNSFSTHLLENRNLSQQGTVLMKMSQKSDGKLISKPVDAQLFNVDLSSVPLPPAAEAVVEHSVFSSQNQTLAFTKKKYNDECNSSKSMSNIVLLPSSLSSASSSSTTTPRIHLPFTSSGLSLSSDVSQISTSVPQPVPPPMPMTSVSTMPPLPLTPVPPVPPPPILPATPSLDISNYQTQNIVQQHNNNVVSSSTPCIDSVDKEVTHSGKKDGLDIMKSLSSLDTQKDSKSDKNHILAKNPNRITRFSLKSPDGGGKPKVSFQIKRKNRPIVGDKTESIVEEEDVINSNPGQFVTRKREMFKPAEAESVTAQQIALIKSLEILENVQKKAQTSPTRLETEPSPFTTDRSSPNDKTVDKTLLSKVSDKISEISLLGKEEEKPSLDDKSQDLASEKLSPEKVREQFSHETSRENLNITNDNAKEIVPHESPSENLNKEKFTEKTVNDNKSVSITPEKSHEPLSTNQSRGKSVRDRSLDHSSTERTHDRSTRDKYDKTSDKSRDRNTHDRSGRDSSHDRSVRGQSCGRGQSYERGGREKSQDRSRDWDRSRDKSTRDRSRERSYDRSSRDRRDRSNRDRSNRDRSRDRSTRDRSRDRATRGRSRDRYMREKSYERSPHEKSDERSLSEKPLERSSNDHIKNRSDNSYEYRNTQRRFNTRERRSRWSERYDDNRYSRTSDRYKRDTYDNRISSHCYDDDYYNRSHYEDKRSRYDDRPFYGQDKHLRTDDVYSDRYDRRNRRNFHPSDERISDMDGCLKDSGSPIRQSFIGSKSSSIGSGINAISVHYSQTSDSDSSPVHNLEGMKSFNSLQYSSSSVVSSSSTVPTNPLPVFGQEHQIQNYSNKLDECSNAANYNYGDSTPVRDEPNDYEINFAQNSAPVNSYQGFGNLYQPNTSAMSWLGPPLEPTQDIEVSQRINTTTIPTVLGDNSSYPSILNNNNNNNMQQKGHANIVPIAPASHNITDPSRININLSNTVTEHRIPTVLKDFPKITRNTSTQNFALTSNVNQLNLSSVSNSTVNLNSNISLSPCLLNSIGVPPIIPPIVPPVAPPFPVRHLPAKSSANFLTRPYEVKRENSNYNVLSNYASSSKTPSQPPAVVLNSNKDFISSHKDQPQCVTSIAATDITVSSFNESKVAMTPQNAIQKSVAPYLADKLRVADSLTQSPKIDSCYKQGLESQILTTSISVKSTDSSAKDYNKYFSLLNKQPSETKTIAEPNVPVKDICSSETKLAQRSEDKLISNQLKNTISADIVVEHVPIIESSHIIEPAETKQRTSVGSHLGEAEVSSSDYLLTEQSTKPAVRTEQPSLEQCTPDSDCTDQKKSQIKEHDSESESQEKRVTAVVNTTEHLCLKDNFEEELMEVDSPESSCYIETNVNMSSAANNNEGQTSDNRDDRSIISTSCSNSQIQDVQTEASHEKTEDNKLYLKLDCKVTDSSTLSNRENEISSSDMQKTSCDILNSENTITTTGNEEKIKYTSSPDLSTSVTVSKYPEASRHTSTDSKHIKFQHVIRSITTDSTYSVDVSSSDEKLPKINKPKFHALQKDRQNNQKLDNLSPKNTSPEILPGKEMKTGKVSGSRPTSRWDVSNPPQCKNSDVVKSSSSAVASSGEIQCSKLLNQNIFEIISESKNIFQRDSQNIASVTDAKVSQVNLLKERSAFKEHAFSLFHDSLDFEDQENVSNIQLPGLKMEDMLKVDQTLKDAASLETQEENEWNESKEPTVLSSNEVSVLNVNSDQLKGNTEENSEETEQTNEEELLSLNDSFSSKTEPASEISVSEDNAEGSSFLETSMRNEDSGKDEDIESPSRDRSMKVGKKSESISQTCLTPAPRRSGRIRSLEEKRVREKEGKKEKDGRTKKDKKEVKTEKESDENEKLVPEEKIIEDPGTKEICVKEEVAKEIDDKKDREGRRTRNRASIKEEEDLKEELDRKHRDLNNKQVKDEKKVVEISKEKPKRVTRNKKLIEPEKIKSDQIGSEGEIKQDESEAAAALNVASDCSPPTDAAAISASQITKTAAVTSSYSLNPTQNSASSLQKDSFQTTSTTTDQPAVNKETKKEDSLTSSRPLKVKSRWRKTMEAEWLSASAHITSTSTDVSNSVSTTVPTTLSPQISPSLQTLPLPSATIVTSSLPSLPQSLTTTSLPSSSYTQPSDLTTPLGSQANIHQTQQATLLQPATSSSLQQPSIEISSSQMSPQQKSQPVVSTTFQSSDEILISSKTASTGSVIEDHRKSYLQKPTVDTILEEEEEEEEEVEEEGKTKDVTLQDDVTNIVPPSIKDTPSRPDVEANKENDGSYEEIIDNIYLTERKKSKQMREVRRMVCDCTISLEDDREPNFEACGEDCLNRMLMIECGSRCPCGEYCNNKRFSRHQYVNVTTFQTENKGLGLMTLEDVLPLTFVMEYVGEVLDYKQFKNRTKQYAKNGQEHYYFMSLNADEVIDATYRGNKSRFINHSCDPNCETQKWTVNGMLRIGFFTKTFINAGQEMTFDYQFESKQAQTCHCGSSCCRGTIGGKKKRTVKSKKKSVSSEKKKKEFEDESNILKLNKQWNNMSQSDDDDDDDGDDDDGDDDDGDGDDDDDGDDNDDNDGDNGDEEDDGDDEQGAVKKQPDGQIKLLMLEEEMERMSQLEGLKNKEHVLNLCRLMVRAESNDHRLSILRILQGTNEQACLRLFLDYHGLPLLWSWMADIGEGAPYLKLQILDTLKMVPITNKTILQESKILPMVIKWANELKLAADPEIETEQSNDNSSQAGTPSSVASRDERPPKKKVKFADETSSDSEMSECSRLSGMIYVNEPTSKNGLNEAADSSDMTYTDYSTQGNLYIEDLDETRSSKSPSSGVPKSGILIKPEVQKELSSESSSSPVVDEKIQSNEAESSSPDILEKSTKEKTEDDTSTKDDDSSNEVKVAADEKNFDSSKLSSVVSLATDLLKHWSDLKEVFKIPKKEKVEERKRTERELERDRKRRYEASPDKNHNRFRTRSDRRRDDVQELLNPNRPRRVLLPTPPKLSKEERRQQFEAQVRAEDERAEFQKQQEAAYIQQQQEYMQQYNISAEGNGYDYYAQHDPNIAYQQDPNMVYQHDPNVAFTQDPLAVVAYQADPVTGLFPNPATYQQDLNAQYQDPNSVYHLANYLIPPPTDPAVYAAVAAADPTVYPVPPPTDPNAYQIIPTDPNVYQIQPPDASAYSVTPTDPSAYQVPPPEQTTFQATTEQTSYQPETTYQITVPPPVTPVPPEPSYPKPSVAVTAATSPAVTQQPSVAETLSEHCFIPVPSIPVVLETVTSQTTPNLSVLPPMTPTYIEPGSSVPSLYSNTPAFSVQSKYMTTPQTSQTTSYPQTTSPQSSSLPQLPPQPPQLPAASLVSVPPPTPSSTPQTPLFVQGQQQPQPPPSAPPPVFYPPTPQALVVPPPQHFSQPQPPTPAVASSQVVQINQGLFACQQVDQLQLQMQNIVLPSTTSTTTTTDDEPPPPPSPPKPKVTKLPDNWKIAKDAEGKDYYYHTLTRQTQWDLPKWDQSDQDDMDLGTPTHDEPQNQSKRKATTTAAADTSSELAKRSKEAFRNKMSQWIVACLNPYRKPDCRLGRISSTDDFKHLARKLTHHVMAKELKHCKHPEDLEVNENVKAKAKDYIKKYMCKFGANYKKAQSPTPDD